MEIHTIGIDLRRRFFTYWGLTYAASSFAAVNKFFTVSRPNGSANNIFLRQNSARVMATHSV
jgi:hypothetical protein